MNEGANCQLVSGEKGRNQHSNEVNRLMHRLNSFAKQPFQGAKRNAMPTVRCPKPTRRNAGLATGPPKRQGQLRGQRNGDIIDKAKIAKYHSLHESAGFAE
jgi:hypothetical protein